MTLSFPDRKVLSKKWQFTYDRQMSYQRIHLFTFGYRVQLPRFFDIHLDSEIYRIKNSTVAVYYEKENHEIAFEKVKAIFSGDESTQWFERIHKTIEDGFQAFIAFTESLPSSYRTASNQELRNTLSACYRSNEVVSLPTWLLYLYVEELLTNELVQRLHSAIPSKKLAEDLFELLSRPTELLPIDAYHRDLYSIALLPENEKDEALAAFANKFNSWGVYDILYAVPGVVFHKDKLKDITPDLARIEIGQINEKYELQRKAIAENSHYWEHDERLNALVVLYRLYANFKDWKNYYREYNSLKMRHLYAEIADRINISLEHAAFLIEDELTNALAGESFPDASEREKRIHESAFVVVEGEECIVTDVNQLAVVDDAIRIIDSPAEIRGISAFRGMATGRVVIIANVGDASKVRDGDILVASTTRPDYAPFMKKCAAFVTNEGGTLSHAAIMARELKIPSVIGTRNATLVLKDGDMVEVDAERGIVIKVNS